MDKSVVGETSKEGTPKTIRIRGARTKKPIVEESSSDSSIEGTFIPLLSPSSSEDSIWVDNSFMNPRFQENEEDCTEEGTLVAVTDLEVEDTAPIFLLFPDLPQDHQHLTSTMSTTQLTKMLVGKKADFSLLKPSKRLSPSQKLPPVKESPREHNMDIEENRKN